MSRFFSTRHARGGVCEQNKAIGETRLGNQAEAQRDVRATQLLDPKCPWLECAAREAGVDGLEAG